MIWDGTKWVPDSGWSAGKPLRYPDGTGVPDSEGVTLAGGDPNAIYVSSESDVNNLGTSRPGVLRYDISSPAATLNATQEWNLTPDLPGLGANLGAEAIAWVPDDILVSKGFVDEATAAAYNPATYPNHGAGLFFVGIEQNGQILAYALNQTNGSFTRVATIASGFPGVMDLEYEPETTHLWAACDDTCGGQYATLDIAQSGAGAGHFVVTNVYDRPTGMPNLNNEGFAIAPQAECVGGLKPVFWSDDNNGTSPNTLRGGTINCTVPVSPPPPDTKVDGSAAASSPQKQKGHKIAVKVTVNAGEVLTADATGAIKAGRETFDLKPVTASVPASATTTLKLKPAKAKAAGEIADALADGKKARAKLTVELADGADNRTTTPLTVLLK